MKIIIHEQLNKVQLIFYCFIFCSFQHSIFSQNQLIQIGGGTANYLNVNVITSSTQNTQVGENTIGGKGMIPNLEAASRFLGQATLGADYETIEAIAQEGFEAWIDEQLAMAYNFNQTDYAIEMKQNIIDTLIVNGYDASNVTQQRAYWYSGWWKHVMSSPDILRAKVTYALSHIFVISEKDKILERNPLSLSNYYDMLSDHTFGNYRDLLEAITYHPAMGHYLTFVNNAKANLTTNSFPDENYAREIMQLFSIGIHQLNMDGTLQLDANGVPIPTYTNGHIYELAKVFTGLTYGDANEFPADYTENSFLMPMSIHSSAHSTESINILDSLTIVGSDTPDVAANIDAALDVLFHHQNVAPFMSYRLIQRLVKSNPSPAYVRRVSTTFEDNGSGVRGDLGAVIKAILLDPEARDCSLINSDIEGMLREPMVMYTHLLRAFNAASTSGYYRNRMKNFYKNTTQTPLGAPSVFNFFSIDYQPPGAIQNIDKVDPVFEIMTSNNIIGYANSVHEWLLHKNEAPMEVFKFYAQEDRTDYYVYLDLEDEILLANNNHIEELIERLNLILMHGQMTNYTRNILRTAALQCEEYDLEKRVKILLYLIMISPDYVILK